MLRDVVLKVSKIEKMQIEFPFFPLINNFFTKSESSTSENKLLLNDANKLLMNLVFLMFSVAIPTVINNLLR